MKEKEITDSQIWKYLDDELCSEEREEFKRLMASDPHLESELNWAKDVDQSLKANFKIEAPRDLLSKTMNRLQVVQTLDRGVVRSIVLLITCMTIVAVASFIVPEHGNWVDDKFVNDWSSQITGFFSNVYLAGTFLAMLGLLLMDQIFQRFNVPK